MNRPRILRWLRISFTAVCLLVCVLLVVLWGRSYTWRDVLYARPTEGRYVDLTSLHGKVFVLTTVYPVNRSILFSPYGVGSHRAEIYDVQPFVRPPDFSLLGYSYYGQRPLGVSVPHGMLLAIVVMLAIMPWLRSIPSRFSLRTLLITVTLAAVVLGVVVMMMRGS